MNASLGDGTTCAVTVAGNVECWGYNEHGQLGQGHRLTLGDDELPSSFGFVDLGGLSVSSVHTNGAQTFALLADGTVRAWGANAAHELGLMHDVQLGDDETPASATVATKPQLGGTVAQLAVGRGFSCARLDTGEVRCFGVNDHGQLGLGHTESIGDDEAPMDVSPVELGAPAIDVAAGAYHACAVLEDGSMRCWGFGQSGQLGLGDTSTIGDDERPIEVPAVELEAAAVRVVAGGSHTCVLLASGSIRCWGRAQEGQLGLGSMEAVGDDELPTDVSTVFVGGVVVDMAAGLEHTCAVLESGALRCWGSGGSGRLGLGHSKTIGDDETPELAGIVDLGSRQAVAIFAGPMSTSTCVRLDGGALRCWGNNDVGQLGYGHTMSIGDDPAEGGGDLPDVILIGDDDD